MCKYARAYLYSRCVCVCVCVFKIKYDMSKFIWLKMLKSVIFILVVMLSDFLDKI
jgi:hypothetical protein